MKQYSKVALFALVVPGVLVMRSVVMLLVINLIFNPTFWMTADGEPITPTPIFITVLNWALLTISAVGLVSLLPGIVGGIFLLTRNKHSGKKA